MLGYSAGKLRAHTRLWRTMVMVAIAAAFALAPSPAKANDPPELLSFSIVHIFENYWLLYGEIDDERPESCLIGFGGVLNGHATAAEADGTYSYVVELPPTLIGYATAQAEDGHNYSNILEDYLYQ